MLAITAVQEHAHAGRGERLGAGEAEAAGAAVLKYGLFINNLIQFLIMAFVVFMIVRQINKLRRQPEEAPNTKECPYCTSAIALTATRCPNCTSQLTA